MMGVVHLSKPSAKGQALCGFTQNYFHRWLFTDRLVHANCPECLAKIKEMHNGQART